ncbi:MAG: class I mannose-6-phosphate isomerase [Akkermansiaceae bacterium]|nr:class I mannose-6-phosphate isomerase [Akkermansiaceae bacterium]
MMKSNYDKCPYIPVIHGDGEVPCCWSGWAGVLDEAAGSLTGLRGRKVLTIECYTGVDEEELADAVAGHLPSATLFRSKDVFLSENEVDALVAPFNGGDDPVFGFMTNLTMESYLDPVKVEAMRASIADVGGIVVLIGSGASLVDAGDVLVYADLARWEAQMRMRRNDIANLGTANNTLKWSLQYKRAFFNDWRVCDELKMRLVGKCDYVLDTCRPNEPKMITAGDEARAYELALKRPFRVVPFFDPAPWGGQWMKRTCDLPDGPENYGWCFDGVPEENSIVFRFGEHFVELPSINLVLREPQRLLGEKVYARFGAEFPIRFDLLDTIGGGHLSFQVHPLTEYIKEQFGMGYTQDESYYMLDADEGATVYLGLKEGIEPDAMLADLEAAQRGEKPFDDEQFVCRWPAKKHDHFLIPAGTCHCSGAGAMVLEISATPYIFTFKLWDWGRLGLDGQPRPINIGHGKKNILWDRTEDMVRRELVNAVEELERTPEWREERTGLHATEFIETRRHWFTGPVEHHTHGGVNMLNLVEGREAVVESPTGAFEPFVVHYAETFIIPAAVGPYVIRPHGESVGAECATLKAFVRS